MVGTAWFFQWSATKTKKKSFHLSSHNFISILGIINCINELKSATFLPPHFSRVPLHRQFLQKSTKICSSIFVPNLSTKIRPTALLSVKNIGFMKLRRTKVNVEILSEELCGLVVEDNRPSVDELTMMALTMSLLLFFRARTAFARDTLACDMTSSMSLTSTPVSST